MRIRKTIFSSNKPPSVEINLEGLIQYLDASKPYSYPGGGGVWNDLSINSNDLNMIGTVTFDSEKGGNFKFNGAQNILFHKSSSIATGQHFTISMWLKTDTLTGNRLAVIGNSYPFSLRNGWYFCLSGAGSTANFFLSVGGDVSYTQSKPINELQNNTWYYLSATVFNGGQIIELYMNGIKLADVNRNNSLGTITYSVRPQYNVGYRDYQGISTDPFRGKIAAVHLYSRVLNEVEILNNFNATKTRFGL